MIVVGIVILGFFVLIGNVVYNETKREIAEIELESMKFQKELAEIGLKKCKCEEKDGKR